MKKNSKNNFLKKLLIFLGSALIVIVILSFLFPGLIWTKNLGISYSKKDFNSILNKLHLKDVDQEIDAEFSSEELTALFNENGNDFCEIKNIQIKINEDNTIELSGKANLDCLLDNILSGNFTRGQIETLIPELGLLPSNVNVYLKSDCSIKNNNINLNIKSTFVQGIKIPDYIISSNEAKTIITSAVNIMISNYRTKSGLNFNNVSIKNGKVIFNGVIKSNE